MEGKGSASLFKEGVMLEGWEARWEEEEEMARGCLCSRFFLVFPPDAGTRRFRAIFPQTSSTKMEPRPGRGKEGGRAARVGPTDATAATSIRGARPP